MANVIAQLNRRRWDLANKTLAAQLYEELAKSPKNCVEYFVSYYDYYQPGAYIPARDIYIERILRVMTISTGFACRHQCSGQAGAIRSLSRVFPASWPGFPDEYKAA